MEVRAEIREAFAKAKRECDEDVSEIDEARDNMKKQIQIKAENEFYANSSAYINDLIESRIIKESRFFKGRLETYFEQFLKSVKTDYDDQIKNL